jgi:hypothetical protein
MTYRTLPEEDTAALLQASILRVQVRKLSRLLVSPHVSSKSWHEAVRQCLLAMHRVYPVVLLERL